MLNYFLLLGLFFSLVYSYLGFDVVVFTLGLVNGFATFGFSGAGFFTAASTMGFAAAFTGTALAGSVFTTGFTSFVCAAGAATDSVIATELVSLGGTHPNVGLATTWFL
ncbi:hypothetical protein D3C86_913250 [compost metagenome]